MTDGARASGPPKRQGALGPRRGGGSIAEMSG